MSARPPLPLNRVVRNFCRAESRATERTFEILGLGAGKPKMLHHPKERAIFAFEKRFFVEKISFKDLLYLKEKSQN
jgi:hypothetical protein